MTPLPFHLQVPPDARWLHPPKPPRRRTPRRAAVAGACLAAGALLLAGGAQAQDAVAPGAVPLCFTDFPPYVSTELPDGGSLGALARRAFAAAGLRVQAIRAPWARAYALARKGDCLLLAIWRNEERDALFRYSLPVARMQLGLFTKAERSAGLPAHARVAVQRGAYLPAELADGRYQLNPVVDMRPALQMLKIGRVDAVFSERASFEHLLGREAPDLRVRWLPPALEVKDAHMAISKTHPQADAWLELLNREIRRLPDTGT